MRPTILLLCIHCHGNVFTKSLPSNDRGTHIQTHRLMGGIYEVHHPDWLRCHDVWVYEDWSRCSKVSRGDSQTHRQYGDLISLLLFFQNKASRLKRTGRSSNHDTNKSSIASSFPPRNFLLWKENQMFCLLCMENQMFCLLCIGLLVPGLEVPHSISLILHATFHVINNDFSHDLILNSSLSSHFYFQSPAKSINDFCNNLCKKYHKCVSYV
jgi:hypothetical protein